MIHITKADRSFVVRADPGDLAPRHESQLNFWGFSLAPASDAFSCHIDSGADVIPRLVAYLKRFGLAYELGPEVDDLLVAQGHGARRLTEASRRGRQFKNADMRGLDLQDFAQFAKQHLARPLKEHQLKAALHLLCVENGANFSVPGSGKTSVVLAVFHWLRSQGLVDALFVVGPPSCFGPWRHEYREVIGSAPAYEIVAGGDVELRRSKYHVNASSAPELYLTTFQTLQRDWGLVRVLLEQQRIRFFLVIDEAHYIKQMDGAWASAVLRIAKHAARRCVLTGTPFPRSYSDGFNLFDVLWPESPTISSEDRHRIVVFAQQRRWHHAAQILEASIGPLFYRVRKDDLGLAPQVFHPPIVVPMKKYERLVYDLILDRIQKLSLADFSQNQDVLARLRRGRMMRLRQCLSYTPLLATAVVDYPEDLVGDRLSVADVIRRYETLERPAKLDALLGMLQQLIAKGQKVVVWSNFIRTLEHVRDLVDESGIGVRLIYGGTPVETSDVEEELSREEIIAQFVDPQSDVRVLVANPAACAESISLHKACTHAIYYDLSYNCAQYVQSLDRIHRVGGSETRPSHYYFLQCGNTIDREMLVNVRRKADNMSRVIDRDYPVYSLDMFEEDDELEAYERLFGGARKRV
jgi:superfamily II DNA or RNA helicase